MGGGDVGGDKGEMVDEMDVDEDRYRLQKLIFGWMEAAGGRVARYEWCEVSFCSAAEIWRRLEFSRSGTGGPRARAVRVSLFACRQTAFSCYV